jgi:CHAD domain-containing protein
MKASGLTRKFFKKRLSALKSLLKKPRKKVSVDDFHELRVEIKKIRAALALLNFSAKGFKRKRTEKGFDKIFKQAGAVRELQLEEQTIKDLHLNTTLKTYATGLRKDRKKEKDKFFKLANKKNIAALNDTYEEVKPFFKEITPQKAQQFLDMERNKIDRLIQAQQFAPKQLHQLRKKFKELNYVLKIFAADNQQAEKTEKLQDILGEWHDKTIVVRHLHKALQSAKLPRPEMSRLDTLRNNLATEKEKLFDKIVGLLKQSSTAPQQQHHKKHIVQH